MKNYHEYLEGKKRQCPEFSSWFNSSLSDLVFWNISFCFWTQWLLLGVEISSVTNQKVEKSYIQVKTCTQYSFTYLMNFMFSVIGWKKSFFFFSFCVCTDTLCTTCNSRSSNFLQKLQQFLQQQSPKNWRNPIWTNMVASLYWVLEASQVNQQISFFFFLNFSQGKSVWRGNHMKWNLTSKFWLEFLQTLIFLYRGSKARSIWFFVHWILGTGVSLLGTLSIYTGLQAYHEKTSRKISLWTTIFTAEICLVTFVYLFQDKWIYIQKQGVILGNELIRPTAADQVACPRKKQNEFAKESCWRKLVETNYLFC